MDRLQKVMAHAGIASRRECEKIIAAGRVKVNGETIIALGYKVSSADIITVDGITLAARENKVYYLINKPPGYVTTTDDPRGRKTVLDLVKVPERIYPVGRLDYDTSGLLILTNDGDLTYRLTHPKHEVDKVYHALVKGEPSDNCLGNLRQGVDLEDGITAPAKVKQLKKIQGNTLLEIIIHEGRNRQVRRMCDAVGNPVLNLERVAIGGLKLGSLATGRYLKVTKHRIQQATER